MAVHCMSNSLNSIAHSVIHPAASELLISCRKGLLVKTTIVWAWKYGLSFVSCYNQSKCELLHWWVPLFNTTECLVGVVHGLLHLVFFSDQGRTNSSWGNS